MNETAQLQGLGRAIAELLPALDRHIKSDGEDRAALRDKWLPQLQEPLPQHGVGADAVLGLLRDVVIEHGLPLGAPGFCGWVTTAPSVIPTAAQLAGAVTANQRWWIHPSNFLEVQSLKWLAALLGIHGDVGGTFTSGGSVANILGIGAARQHAGERLGIDVANVGVHGLPNPRVYASDQVHHVALRAMGVLGMGRAQMRRIPTSRTLRVDLTALERAMDDDIAAGCTPVAVIGSAGDVNTGSVEPLDALRAIAHARDTWFHVDGAYGGFGLLDKRVAPLFGDVNQFDSFAIDPHKWMGVPVGCGAIILRNPGFLDRAFTLEPAAYYPDEVPRDADPKSCFDGLGQGSPDRAMEHSSPSRGLWVWALLKEIGADGMRARVTRHLDCARRVAERVENHPDLELLSAPVLSICCFRYHPPDVRDTATLERTNLEIMRRVRARGRSIPSKTRVNNKLAIRPCFIGPQTTLEHADRLVDEVLAVAPEALAFVRG